MGRAKQVTLFLAVAAVLFGLLSCMAGDKVPVTPEFKAQAVSPGGVYTDSIIISNEADATVISPRPYTVWLTSTLVLNYVMEVRGPVTKTITSTTVYTPGQLSTPGTGTFKLIDVRFDNLQDGNYKPCARWGWIVDGDEILGYYKKDGVIMPRDSAGYTCFESFSIQSDRNNVYLPIIFNRKPLK